MEGGAGASRINGAVAGVLMMPERIAPGSRGLLRGRVRAAAMTQNTPGINRRRTLPQYSQYAASLVSRRSSARIRAIWNV